MFRRDLSFAAMASRTNPSSATTEELGLRKALIRVSQLLPAALDRELRTVGESLTRYEIRAMLSGCPDGVQMSELGRLALVSKPRLSVHVAELESECLVDRRQDPDDGRATIITLTAAGRRHLAKLSPAHVDQATQIVFDRIEPRTREVVLGALVDVLDGLGDDWRPGERAD